MIFMGGGGKIIFVLDFLSSRAEPGFFVWYGPGFFSARIMRIKQTKKFII